MVCVPVSDENTIHLLDSLTLKLRSEVATGIDKHVLISEDGETCTGGSQSGVTPGATAGGAVAEERRDLDAPARPEEHEFVRVSPHSAHSVPPRRNPQPQVVGRTPESESARSSFVQVTPSVCPMSDLLPDDLDQHALAPPSVELAVEDPLPQAISEAPDSYDDDPSALDVCRVIRATWWVIKCLSHQVAALDLLDQLPHEPSGRCTVDDVVVEGSRQTQMLP